MYVGGGSTHKEALKDEAIPIEHLSSSSSSLDHPPQISVIEKDQKDQRLEDNITTPPQPTIHHHHQSQ